MLTLVGSDAADTNEMAAAPVTFSLLPIGFNQTTLPTQPLFADHGTVSQEINFGKY